MPYNSGEIPGVGDHVKHSKTGRMGVVTDVQLNVTSLQGRDQISVKWDDGGAGVGKAVADEYDLVGRDK